MPKLTLSRFQRSTVAAMTLVAAMTTSAFAQNSAQSRLNLAGDLNVLAHQVAASACMIENGIRLDAEMKALAQARTSFNDTMAALHEDADVQARWRPIESALRMILAGDEPATYASIILNGAGALASATTELRDVTTRIYTVADGVRMSDGLTVDLAQRQEVFVQQFKHLACDMTSDEVSYRLAENLGYNITAFDMTLFALRNGMPEMGLYAPTDNQVNQALAAADVAWQDVKPQLYTIAARGTTNADNVTQLAAHLDILDQRMGALVDQYLTTAPTVAHLASLQDDPS